MLQKTLIEAVKWMEAQIQGPDFKALRETQAYKSSARINIHAITEADFSRYNGDIHFLLFESPLLKEDLLNSLRELEEKSDHMENPDTDIYEIVESLELEANYVELDEYESEDEEEDIQLVSFTSDEEGEDGEKKKPTDRNQNGDMRRWSWKDAKLVSDDEESEHGMGDEDEPESNTDSLSEDEDDGDSEEEEYKEETVDEMRDIQAELNNVGWDPKGNDSSQQTNLGNLRCVPFPPGSETDIDRFNARPDRTPYQNINPRYRDDIEYD